MRQRWFLVVAVVVTSWGLPYIGVAQQSDMVESMIVVFRRDAALAKFRQFYRSDDRARQDAHGWGYLNRDVIGAVQALESRLQFRADHVYSAALRGFAARLNASQIAALRNHPMVAYLEADSIMTAQNQTVPWGIERIGAPQSSTAAGDGVGEVSNVNIYIIDSGINRTHPDLNMVKHVNFTFLRWLLNFDCNGHGSLVAGIAAAKDNTAAVVGVAPGARLTGVKVLNCLGVGEVSRIIKGVDWVTANAQKPAVANMSLGGGISQALDDAVLNSVASGIFYAIAAGNAGEDACMSSPARIGGSNDGVMTVAATDMNEQEPDWSNYGTCVDIWAPGADIPSTSLDGGTETASGTSMAAPHVAGAAALLLSSFPTAPPAALESVIKQYAFPTGTKSKDERAIVRLDVSEF